MDPYEDRYGSLWILMDPYGSLWILMDPYGSLWILMDPYGSLIKNKPEIKSGRLYAETTLRSKLGRKGVFAKQYRIGYRTPLV